MSDATRILDAAPAQLDGRIADPPSQPTSRFMRAPAGSTRTLIAALELGILGDYLMRADDPGVGLTLWCWALLIAALIVGARMNVAADRRRLLLLSAAAFFAAVPAWRASEPIVLFSGLAVLTLLVLSSWTASLPSIQLVQTALGSYIRAAWTGFVHIVFGALPLFAAEARARSELRGAYRRPAGAALRGLALSIPIVLVLGALLAKADPAYEALVGNLLHWDAGTIVSHLLLAGIFTWFAAAYLCASLTWGHPGTAAPATIRLGVIEGGVVLGVVNLLFLSFMLVQLQYLFGGTQHVLETAGLTYAEYARRGFFELVTVTALTLPVLVGVTASVRPESALERRVHHGLAAALVVLLLALVMSAAGRMRLYQLEYGWTLDRVHATVLMLWIGGCILWFAATVLRGRSERFAFGAITGGLAMLGALAVTNPAALVVRANAARVASGHDFDGIHAVSLGYDGLPALLDVLPVIAPSLDANERCFIRDELARIRARSDAASDWRAWNLSRDRARSAVARRAASAARYLGDAACPTTRAAPSATGTAPAEAPASVTAPAEAPAIVTVPATPPTTVTVPAAPPPR
jgi:hypothetical protein